MASVEKRPPAKKIPKKLAPKKKRKVPEEELKIKQGEIEVKKSKKAKRAIEEKKISDTEEVLYVQRVPDSEITQLKCFVMMPTDEELKELYVAQLYLKNPMIVPQAPHDVFFDSDISVIADKSVKVAMEFLNADWRKREMKRKKLQKMKMTRDKMMRSLSRRCPDFQGLDKSGPNLWLRLAH
ncbi:hypothetical protein TIFTF001_017596 [Ficus carica]|uniref:Uncharacterized protein n=1 Tax=Ficus carica TaxID=3494 RepID=A0AA88A9I3_FICCA|nr:hypothetical protein TIFTF001_017596 [Ficus carica]